MVLDFREIRILLNAHSSWMNPVFAVLSGACFSFMQYSIPLDFQKSHSDEAVALQLIIANLWWIGLCFTVPYILVVINDWSLQKSIKTLENELPK